MLNLYWDRSDYGVFMLASFSWEHTIITYMCYLAHRIAAWTALIIQNNYYNSCLWEISEN